MSRAIRLGVALALVSGPLLSVSSARAESAGPNAVPVYVLTIWTEDADDQAESLTQALRWSVRQTKGWSLLESSQSFETLAIALKCPPRPDPACLLRIGDQLKADHYVWGTMDRKRAPRGNVNADLHMWTRDKADAAAAQTYSDSLKDPADGALRAIASDLFEKLGSSVRSGSASSLAGVGAPAHPAEDAEASREFPLRTAVAYSAIAIGAGLLVASGIEAALWVGDDNTSTNDRKLIPSSVTDVCSDPLDLHALDACAKSKDAVNASTLAWVFAGGGVAFAVTGIWLLATEQPAAESRAAASAVGRPNVEVVPSLQARSGSVTVRVTF